MDKKEKTYENLGDAVFELKVEANNVSYDIMSMDAHIARSQLYDLVKRRRVSLPDYEIMEKLANYFRIKPEYFYEYRLRRFLDYLDEHREFLEECDLFIRKVKKQKEEPPIPPKNKKEISKTKKKSKVNQPV